MSSLAQGRSLVVDMQRPAFAAAKRSHAVTPRRRTLAALAKLAALVAGIVMFAMFAAGCASAPQVAEYDYENASKRDIAEGSRALSELPPRPKKVAFDAPDDAAPQANADGTTLETQALAAQSQRDVDLLLNGRGGESQGTSDAGGAKVESTPNAARPSPIVWNEPSVPASAAQPNSVEAPNVIAAGPPNAAATQPAASQPDHAGLQPDRLKQLTVDLARELYASGAYSDHPLRELTVIAAMQMVDADRALDPAAIPDLTDGEREVLANLQTFFGSVGKVMSESEDVSGGVAQAAATLRQSLAHEPHLKVPTVVLCSRVGGFGDFAPLSQSMFLAGSEAKAIVYLEIEGFVSDINQNSEFVTELSQQLTIYSDRDGIPVWKDDWQAATDVSRNKRQDFFTVQVITLPKALSVGKYTLKIRVRDERSKAETETSVPIDIVADPKMIKD